DIPILAKYKFDESFSAVLGPQVGILTSAKFDDGDNTEDAKDFYKTLDLGIAGGLEYELDMGLIIGARGYYGLLSIAEDYEETIITYDNMGNPTGTTTVEVEAPT